MIRLEIPPLRERREDIPSLVHHLLERINEKVHKRVTRVPEEVMELLTRLPWRGNVRELENVLTNAVVRSPGAVLVPDDLPLLPSSSPQSLEAPSLQQWLEGEGGADDGKIPTLDEAERILIIRALAATRGHKGKTCQILGISRPTLERKLQRYGVVTGSPDAGKDPR